MIRPWRPFLIPVTALAIICYFWAFNPLGRTANVDRHFEPVKGESKVETYEPRPVETPLPKVDIVEPVHEIPAKVKVHLPMDKTATLAAVEDLLRPVENGETPYGPVPRIASHNRKTLEVFVDCIFDGTCTKNQSKSEFLQIERPIEHGSENSSSRYL
jgi:hypothetical protein